MLLGYDDQASECLLLNALGSLIVTANWCPAAWPIMTHLFCSKLAGRMGHVDGCFQSQKPMRSHINLVSCRRKKNYCFRSHKIPLRARSLFHKYDPCTGSLCLLHDVVSQKKMPTRHLFSFWSAFPVTFAWLSASFQTRWSILDGEILLCGIFQNTAGVLTCNQGLV